MERASSSVFDQLPRGCTLSDLQGDKEENNTGIVEVGYLLHLQALSWSSPDRSCPDWAWWHTAQGTARLQSYLWASLSFTNRAAGPN